MTKGEGESHWATTTGLFEQPLDPRQSQKEVVIREPKMTTKREEACQWGFMGGPEVTFYTAGAP